MVARVGLLFLVICWLVACSGKSGDDPSPDEPTPEAVVHPELRQSTCPECGYVSLRSNKLQLAALEDYQPNTGDPGLDEFLLGCYLQLPPGPDRQTDSPHVLYLLAAPDGSQGEVDEAQAVAEVRALCDPPDAQLQFPGIPDYFYWASYGKYVPRITVLAEDDKPYYYSGEHLWEAAGTAAELDAAFNFGQWFNDGVGDTLIWCQADQSNHGGGIPSNFTLLEFPSAPQWVSSYVVMRHDYALGYPNVDQRYGTNTLMHELGHALLNFDDQYITTIIGPSGIEGSRNMNMLGLMGSVHESGRINIPGVLKTICGWCPMVRVKYDVDNLVVRYSGIPDASREAYYLGPEGAIGREFFVLENVGIYPHLEYPNLPVSPNWFSGLFVVHCLLPKLYADEGEYRADRSVPWITWMMANGREPWANSGREWALPWNSPTARHLGLYPLGSAELAADTTPSSRRWDGTETGIRLSQITQLDNFRKDLLPAWFPFSEVWYEAHHVNGAKYGLITLSAEVGRHLPGDFNNDGVVGQGDHETFKLNLGQPVGGGTFRLPVDMNGDGQVTTVTDRDGDGYIATSERFYDGETPIAGVGDWIDFNRDAINDLDPDRDGVADPALVDADGDGLIDLVDRDQDGQPDPVPAWMDANGDGAVNELDAALVGYHWGETCFEELWVPKQPVPDWGLEWL